MAAIISTRGVEDYDRMFRWLKENAEDYIATKASVTFLHDNDALAFTLAFNVINATYNPQILNKNRNEQD